MPLPTEFYRPLTAAASVSSLGLGTYLGECTDAEDARYYDIAIAAFDRGVTLIDTAINYRGQRAERTIGRALATWQQRATVNARPIVVSTKGGYVPLDTTPPRTKTEYQDYLKREYFDRKLIRPDELVAAGHCIAPAYLTDQVARSRANLGVQTIDLYYLHNPEQQLDTTQRDAFHTRLRDAFATLEECVAAGHIRAYGCATWHGLRVTPDAPNYLHLETLVRLAHDVAGDSHHFAAIQLPLNLAMTEAIRLQNQTVQGTACTTLEAARALGLSVLTSAPLMQAQLAKNLPDEVRTAIPNANTDAQRALTFVHTLPGVTSVLVGMRTRDHLNENLEIAAASNN
jgi:aryl-alcohol dehydrogenase-like predicted oxidoreductase